MKKSPPRYLQALAVALFSLCISTAKGNIRLPAIINNDMVLQRETTVTLWGWANPNEKIKITTSWNNRVDSVTTTGDATWQIQIPTPKAGGPYTITLQGWNTITLNNVLIGEVWVCSGQSNMEWSGNQVWDNVVKAGGNLNNPNIRFFHTPKTTAQTVQDNSPGNWTVCNEQTIRWFSAVGYFFGKRLNEELNVPIGLINASWGGTPAEVWTPANIVNNNPSLLEASKKIAPAQWWPNTPGIAYNAMIAPITKFNIAGTIWYQGESNKANADAYTNLFTSMIKAWRDDWKKVFPFYFVQIAPYNSGDKDQTGALVREAQANTEKLENTGMVVVTDLVDNINDIHP
ncbi:sialate O-acetylesterase [Chitinophaga skermanii]|uniref:Sialate O-acetylesterase n=1 Tax=Chitinophaga skermanii TaxID=331697 RepID=A0A327R2N9_9BACT|nr:sialate O-acetylesterase [Chitinophaga skermanii]RAJ10950.1 sialate O-acetylesterase [Chitinophaga skermanii]